MDQITSVVELDQDLDDTAVVPVPKSSRPTTLNDFGPVGTLGNPENHREGN